MRVWTCVGCIGRIGAERAVHELRIAASRCSDATPARHGAGTRRRAALAGLCRRRHAASMAVRVRSCVERPRGACAASLVRGVRAAGLFAISLNSFGRSALDLSVTAKEKAGVSRLLNIVLSERRLVCLRLTGPLSKACACCCCDPACARCFHQRTVRVPPILFLGLSARRTASPRALRTSIVSVHSSDCTVANICSGCCLFSGKVRMSCVANTPPFFFHHAG